MKLQPVVPVVFYTGTRHWESLGTIVDLIELGAEIGGMVPRIEPLFINLSEISGDELESKGGVFGWVLRLIQACHDSAGDFKRLLSRVVRHLDELPQVERSRWLELLSYIHALIYHERGLVEHNELRRTIVDSINDAREREETVSMGKTIAEALREEGREEGQLTAGLQTRRATLTRQLRRRFKRVPLSVSRVIESTVDAELLDDWLDRLVTAETLTEVGIK